VGPRALRRWQLQVGRWRLVGRSARWVVAGRVARVDHSLLGQAGLCAAQAPLELGMGLHWFFSRALEPTLASRINALTGEWLEPGFRVAAGCW
jgi:hypothetical protein